MDNAREAEGAGIPSGDENSIGKRHGRAMAVAAGLAIVVVLGGAAWASGALSGLSDPADQKSATEQIKPIDKKEPGVAVSVKADSRIVDAVTVALPEAEREAVRAHPSAKREDPSSDKVAAKPSKPAVGGKPSGGGTPSVKPPAAHKHTWVDVTERRWVANNVWVVDQAAWDEDVVVGNIWHCNCGASFNSASVMGAHEEEMALAGQFNHGGWVETIYETIHHEEIGRYEDRGRYETVVVGRKCSGCGQAG